MSRAQSLPKSISQRHRNACSRPSPTQTSFSPGGATEPSVELSLFEMDARPGGHWRFKGRPAPGSDHGDVGEQLKRNAAQEFEAYGEVLEYVPPRVLV